MKTRSPRASRVHKAGKGRAFRWKPVTVYALLVVAVSLGVAAWDRAYEARLRPQPRLLAKNLVESIIGPGSVHTITLDEKTGSADLVVEDVLIKPGQSRTEMEKNLSTEGSLAIQLLRGRMGSLKAITLHLVKAGKPLATVRVDPVHPAPAAEFAPDLKSP